MIRLVLFLQLPGLVAAAGLVAIHQAQERYHGGELLLPHSRALAAALGERVQGIERQLQVLATRVPSDRGAIAAFEDDALLVKRLAGVDSIVLTTATGERLMDTRTLEGLPVSQPLPNATRDTDAAAEGPRRIGLVASGVERSDAATVGLPIARGGTTYLLAATLHAPRLLPLLATPALPPGWVAAIVDPRGGVVASLPDTEPFAVDEPLRAAMQRNDSGVFPARGADGAAGEVAYTRTAVAGWTAVVRAPRADLHAALWRSAHDEIVALLVAFPLTLWLSLRLALRRAPSAEPVRRVPVVRGPAQGDEPAGRPFPAPRLLTDPWLTPRTAIRRRPPRRDVADLRFAQIVRTAADAILVCNDQHLIVLANDAAARLFGRPAAAMQGSELASLLTPETTRQWLALDFAADDADASVRGEPVTGHALRTDGSAFPVEYTLAPFADARGRRFCSLVVRDIGRRRQTEESLVATRAELQRLNQAFQSALLKDGEARQAAIARELHDAVGSSLAGLSLLLATARSFTREPEAAALISKSQQQVTQTAQQIRQISRGMMPTGQEPGALLPALEHFAADMSIFPGLHCHVHSRGDFEDVPVEVAGHLFRIVQEATNNAVRHGQATRVQIRLARVGDRCRLTVADNGTGCDISALCGIRSGIGVRSMRARAQAIGGRLDASLPAGGGLRIRCSWFARPGN